MSRYEQMVQDLGFKSAYEFLGHVGRLHQEEQNQWYRVDVPNYDAVIQAVNDVYQDEWGDAIEVSYKRFGHIETLRALDRLQKEGFQNVADLDMCQALQDKFKK